MMQSQTRRAGRATVSGFLSLLCLALCLALCSAVCCAVVHNSAFAQRPAAPLRLKSEAPKPAVHPDAAVTIELDLCVVGGTNPNLCPPNPSDDITYVPAITYTYGQFLDGVVRATATSGTITIFANRTLFCTLQIGITTACPAISTIFDSGSYTIVADYNANDGTPAVVSLPVSVSIAQDSISSLSIASSLNPAPLGTAVTFTAKGLGNYSAIPAGQVTFSEGTTTLGTAIFDPTGSASFTISTLSLGTHTIVAAYPGSVNFLPAPDATFTQNIVPPATSTTLASSLNPSTVGENDTFTATVTAIAGLHPAGAVDFNDGTRTFATTLVTPAGASPSGTAQATISTLASGTHNITAAYSGDAATSSSTSAALVQQVAYPLTMAPLGYTIAVTPSPVVLGVGLTAHLIVTVTPRSGFASPVTLACTGLPHESACTFGETVIPSGGGTTTLDLATMAPHDCGSSSPYFLGANHPPTSGRTLRYGTPAFASLPALLLPVIVLPVLLLPRPSRKRRLGQARTRLLRNGLFAICALVSLAATAGCSQCTDFGTYPGHYTFFVTGTAPAAGSTPAATGTGTVNVQTGVALSVVL